MSEDDELLEAARGELLSGELEFTISRSDLAERRFDRCRARTQGG